MNLTTCDLSDACDLLRIPACRTGAILPVWPECPPVFGRIATVTLAPRAGAPLRGLIEAIARTDAELLLVDLEGCTHLQSWGTVLATVARRCGLTGAIVNGATRDVRGLAEMSFPTFARGVSPLTSNGRLELVGANRPVRVDGDAVEVGWFGAADANGVVFFPPNRAEAVLAEAARLVEDERERLAAIRAGADPIAALFGHGTGSG
ncbi:MAG: RraA family protein [Vicinamibacteria bacterium]